MRCFIDIEISDHIKSKIFHEFENLQTKNLFSGKFVEKENLHLTLKFLGDLTNEGLEKIKNRLRRKEENTIKIIIRKIEREYLKCVEDGERKILKNIKILKRNLG